MSDYRHDPNIDYSTNLLKQAGTEAYTSGRDTTAKGISELQPVSDYFRRLLSGDTKELMSMFQPEYDAIGHQFNQVRQMINFQPRGGGKTSALAQLPAQEVGATSRLLTGARGQGAEGMGSVAQKYLGTGVSQTGLGIGASGASGELAMGGRNADIANSWKTFFKNLALDFAKGAGEGAGAAMV